MVDESFMLLSLKENKSKKVAQVIGNDTCRAMLDYLATKEFATETQIANDLKLPLSTVHYNIKLLAESGMIMADEYHYSEKGKEVPHYKLARKIIIIAPKDDDGSIMERMKRFLPMIGIIAVGTAVVETARRLIAEGSMAVVAERSMAAGSGLAMDAVVDEAVANGTPMLMAKAAEFAPQAAPLAASAPPVNPIALWFLAGGLFALLVMALWDFTRKK